MRLDVRRWWCDAHRHLAAPGDMEPGVAIRLAEAGRVEVIR